MRLEPKRSNQCAFMTKAHDETHPATRRKAADPYRTTQIEPNRNNTVVAVLMVQSTALYQPSTVTSGDGHTGQAAKRNACHPGRPWGKRTPCFSTGRNHADTWSTHATAINVLALVA